MNQVNQVNQVNPSETKGTNDTTGYNRGTTGVQQGYNRGTTGYIVFQRHSHSPFYTLFTLAIVTTEA